jgi:cytochrome c oxidase subunit 2
VDKLYFFITAVTALFALLVVICVIVFAIKDHDRTGERVDAPGTGSIPLELAWSIVPFVVSMAIFAWTTVAFFELVRPPDQTLEIHSTSKRWIWRFRHVDAQSEISEPHVSFIRELFHNLVSAQSTGGVRDEAKR